jgi:proteasome lid subunit RPN8/RPN11
MLEKVILMKPIADLLFGEYGKHLQGPHAEKEMGWVLLGHTSIAQYSNPDKSTTQSWAAMVTDIISSSTTGHDSGVGHFVFDSDEVLRQYSKLTLRKLGLEVLGMVHTHPGGNRYPSDADLLQDLQWVPTLKAKKGIFGIGTEMKTWVPAGDYQTRPYLAKSGMVFTFFLLRMDSDRYEPIEVSVQEAP